MQRVHVHVLSLLALATGLSLGVPVFDMTTPKPEPDINFAQSDWRKMSIMTGWGSDQEPLDSPPEVAVIPNSPPPIKAFMGDLDYGGQPPNYDYEVLRYLHRFPVDRREGAPHPLKLSPSRDTWRAEDHMHHTAIVSLPKQEDKPKKQPFFLGALVHKLANIARDTGKETQNIASKVGESMKKAGSLLFG